ncbi:hypothetical protein Tco_0977822 [Tanacetum coccineum]|uniref:Uncharacterized protein n=1 Tax=Tanacetum coccineum TaxID=301880 RepID=A0ABQ5EL96_9ASTR
MSRPGAIKIGKPQHVERKSPQRTEKSSKKLPSFFSILCGKIAIQNIFGTYQEHCIAQKACDDKQVPFLWHVNVVFLDLFGVNWDLKVTEKAIEGNQ